MDKVIHFAVAGTKQDGAALVPYCAPGFAAFRRGSLVVMNTIFKEVTCEHCKKYGGAGK